ncbi:hypothetical protein [Rhodococcoides kroppenstedtii]|uniref:hypothetical protein n=1 Tax=Rhodococcoides kroppenstedtii TaxID=293050 RepID=UPI003645736E
MKMVVGAGLLLSAFAPLVALLALLNIGTFGWRSWLLLAGCALSVLLMKVVLTQLTRWQARGIEATSIRRADERVLAFTSSYIVPSVVALFGGSAPQSVGAVCALVGLLAVIYVRAGLYHLNPTLAVLGFRLYEVTSENGVVTMVLSRRGYIPQQDSLQCRYIGEDVAIDVAGGDI